MFWWLCSAKMLRKVDKLPWQLTETQRATFNYEAKSRLMRAISSLFFSTILIMSPDATPVAVGVIAVLGLALAATTWVRSTPAVVAEQARIDALQAGREGGAPNVAE
jgi:hypothetical protein